MKFVSRVKVLNLPNRNCSMLHKILQKGAKNHRASVVTNKDAKVINRTLDIVERRRKSTAVLCGVTAHQRYSPRGKSLEGAGKDANRKKYSRSRGARNTRAPLYVGRDVNRFRAKWRLR